MFFSISVSSPVVAFVVALAATMVVTTTDYLCPSPLPLLPTSMAPLAPASSKMTRGLPLLLEEARCEHLSRISLPAPLSLPPIPWVCLVVLISRGGQFSTPTRQHHLLRIHKVFPPRPFRSRHLSFPRWIHEAFRRNLACRYLPHHSRRPYRPLDPVFLIPDVGTPRSFRSSRLPAFRYIGYSLALSP